MKIIRTSMFTGKRHEREINVSEAEYALWQSGVFIQDAMPNVSAADREFIMSGVTPEEWDEAFADMEDES